MDQIKQLFSPPMLAALRYLLASLAPLLAVVGIVALSPQQIDKIIAVAQQVGVAVGAFTAFLGIVIPVIMGAIGTHSATQSQQIKSVQDIATGPASANAVSAQTALISATTAVAQDQSIPKSTEAKAALLDAAAAMPEVVGKISVTDPSLVIATTSDQIQKAA